MRVVVIGSGHNGLVCAAMLARAGHEVLVLEGSEIIGGATRTTEIVPGYRTSAASYSLSLFRPDVWRSLGLGDRVRLVRKEPAVSVPYPDGRWLSLRADPDRTRASIESIHPPDADAYPRWNAFMEQAAIDLRPFVDAPEPPSIEEVRAAIGSARYDLLVDGSAAALASSFFASDELRGLMACQGIVGTPRSVDDPGTAWILTFHAIGGEVVGATGAWANVIGGTGAIARAIADVAVEAGATIRTGARVASIRLDDGRIAGVALDDASAIDAEIVVSNAHPFVTDALLDGMARETPAVWETASRTFKVNVAMRRLPVFANDPDGDACRGTVSFTWGLEHLRAAHANMGTPADPWMEVFIGSAVDPSLVDGSGATLSAFAQYAGDDFDADAAAAAVIASLETAAPGFADDVVGTQVLGPADLEREIGLVGGNIFHGELAPPQVFDGRLAARTGIDGLYRCGSGCHPGGAITGAPGRNAALAILADCA